MSPLKSQAHMTFTPYYTINIGGGWYYVKELMKGMFEEMINISFVSHTFVTLIAKRDLVK